MPKNAVLAHPAVIVGLLSVLGGLLVLLPAGMLSEPISLLSVVSLLSVLVGTALAFAGYFFMASLNPPGGPQEESRSSTINVSTFPVTTWSEAYKIVSDYDTHYSTVRMTVVTFLLTFSFGLASFLLKDSHALLTTGFGITIPFMFLLLAVFLNCHFQRLTTACRKLQNALDAGNFKTTRAGEVMFSFRPLLKTYYDETKWWTWHDPANIALAGVFFLFIVSVSVFITVKGVFPPERACVVRDSTVTATCDQLKR